jgi:hypothetical protein
MAVKEVSASLVEVKIRKPLSAEESILVYDEDGGTVKTWVMARADGSKSTIITCADNHLVYGTETELTLFIAAHNLSLHEVPKGGK